MFRVGLHLCGLVIILAPEDIVCDHQIVFRAKTQKTFNVSVALDSSTQANHTWPFVHHSNPDIEVTACYQFISTRNSPQNSSAENPPESL